MHSDKADFEIIREWLYFSGNLFSLKQKLYLVDSGICVLYRFFGSVDHIDFRFNSVQVFHQSFLISSNWFLLSRKGQTATESPVFSSLSVV